MIKQSESESFTQFVDRFQAAVDSSTLPAEAKRPGCGRMLTSAV